MAQVSNILLTEQHVNILVFAGQTVTTAQLRHCSKGCSENSAYAQIFVYVGNTNLSKTIFFQFYSEFKDGELQENIFFCYVFIHFS